MSSSPIPVCYFPTTVAFVDDSKRFLKNIHFKLDENMVTIFLSDPAQALEVIKENAKPLNLLENCLALNPYDTDIELPGQQAAKVNVAKLCEIAYNPQRFQLISVMVVDYYMPVINGLGVCEQLKDIPIKKIMVTGEADQMLAVEAFNAGLIDQFILKGDPDFDAKINQAINEFQKQYFAEITEKLSAILSLDPEYCLDDPIFIQEFLKICAEKKIVEYYLFKNNGSFLLMDISGQPYWLIVQRQDDIQMFTEFAKQSNTPASTLRQLESGQKIAILSERKSLPQGAEWENYMHDATVLSGKNKLYYTLLEKLPADVLEFDRIRSYQHYLK